MIKTTLAVLLILGMPAIVLEEASIVPTDRVVNGVNIRASATTASSKIGILLPGESAAFIGEVPNRYHIDHPQHDPGFVSEIAETSRHAADDNNRLTSMLSISGRKAPQPGMPHTEPGD